MLQCLGHAPVKFFLHPNCILLYQNETSAVTPLGSKLLWGSLKNVDSWEKNNTVTYHPRTKWSHSSYYFAYFFRNSFSELTHIYSVSVGNILAHPFYCVPTSSRSSFLGALKKCIKLKIIVEWYFIYGSLCAAVQRTLKPHANFDQNKKWQGMSSLLASVHVHNCVCVSVWMQTSKCINW